MNSHVDKTAGIDYAAAETVRLCHEKGVADCTDNLTKEYNNFNRGFYYIPRRIMWRVDDFPAKSGVVFSSLC